ncbi:MAG: hypothetical protein N4A45_09175 [Flavobacteriales bacterium]|jgi:spore coat polysaccharide biosynthesis predicted glycosyltransferase SpsG|nr:hypothetical protein [Flavobacteriales bacterium]
MIQNSILFRCDQNEFSGFGHFSRCLNLARHLVGFGYDISFLGNYSEFAKTLFDKYEILFQETQEKKFEKVDIEIFKKYQYVLFDSYFIHQNYLDESLNKGFKTIFIDDTCTLDFTGVDLVINFRFNAEKMFKYHSKQSALGINFFIYKPELSNVRAQKSSRNTIEKVLLFFGGLEAINSKIDLIIDTLKKQKEDLEIWYIASNFDHVSEENRKRIKMLYPTFDIENILLEVDAIINGGGLIKYESSFAKVLPASIATTDLQLQDSLILEKLGILYNFGKIEELDELSILDKMGDFIQNKELHKQLKGSSDKHFTTNSIHNIVDLIRQI